MLRRAIPQLKRLDCQFNPNLFFAEGIQTLGEDPLYAHVPMPCRNKSERKPYPTPMKVLIRKAKEEKEARKAQPCRILQEAPDNGLLVPQLVPVAHRLYLARLSLLSALSHLVKAIPVQRCRFCFEVHIGHEGHDIRTCTGPNSGIRNATHIWRKGGIQDLVFFPKCFHLYDRVGKPRVGHDEKNRIPRVPAIVELCIQAGLDLDRYPSKRRTKPVYCIEGRIVDFESMAENDEIETRVSSQNVGPLVDSVLSTKIEEQMMENVLDQSNSIGKNLKDLSIQTLHSWFEMISGTKELMEKYSVKTCGYCPEVQVGPKGHKVRMCKASKHQSRNGLHAWQEATMDDLVGPNYVWHVQDINKPILQNNLKRYYGKAPAVVEMCVQAGAPVPEQYMSMMRLDVVSPDRDEVDLVA